MDALPKLDNSLHVPNVALDSIVPLHPAIVKYKTQSHIADRHEDEQGFDDTAIFGANNPHDRVVLRRNMNRRLVRVMTKTAASMHTMTHRETIALFQALMETGQMNPGVNVATLMPTARAEDLRAELHQWHEANQQRALRGFKQCKPRVVLACRAPVAPLQRSSPAAAAPLPHHFRATAALLPRPCSATALPHSPRCSAPVEALSHRCLITLAPLRGSCCADAAPLSLSRRDYVGQLSSRCCPPLIFIAVWIRKFLV